MPQLGETVTEGTITKWFKQVGDQVAEDEALFEVSTDKVDSEVPSPVAGYLTEIRVPEGDTVDVGTVLAVSATRRRPAAAPTARAEAEPSAPEPAAPPSRRRTGPRRPHRRPAASRRRRPRPAARPRRTAASAGSRRAEPGAGRRHRAGCCRRSCAGSSPSTASTPRGSTAPARAGASPATTCEPVIDAGTVARHRRRRRVPARPRVPRPRPRPPPPPRPAAAPARARGPGAPVGHAATPSSRSTTSGAAPASTWSARKATSPHALTAVEVDYENVERVRRAASRASGRPRRASASPTCRSSPGPSSTPSRDFPHLNARWATASSSCTTTSNLGIAVDLDFEGLHRAGRPRRRRQAAAGHRPRDRDLADRARTKKLSARRHQRRHVHHHQHRLVRHAA